MSDGIQGAPSGAPAVPTLAENEAIIARGLTAFMDVGQALMRIRDSGQYRATHTTFEAYLAERWQMKRKRGYELMSAAGTAAAVSEISDIPISSESVAKALKPLAEEPEAMAEVWEATVTEHGPKPTAEQVREKVQERKPKDAPRERREYGNNYWENDDVIAWVARRMKAGKSRDEIFAEAQVHAHDCPVIPGQKPMSKNTIDICRGIIKDRRRRGDTTRRREPRESGKRLRAISLERKQDPKPIRDVQFDMMRMVGILEAIDLPANGLGDADEFLVADVFDDLTRLKHWVDGAMDVTVGHMDNERKQAKIRTLRQRAEDPSSTPNERKTAGVAADKLAKKYRMVEASL